MKIDMRFPGGKPKALTFSYDDNVEQDFRLIDILKKNNLKGTFNLNSGLYKPEGTVYEKGTIHRPMSKEEATGLYTANGMEVAIHFLTHPFPDRISDNVCSYEISQDRANLEQQFGTIVRGCAYPYGAYTDKTVEILKNNNIAYARTVCSSHSFSIPSDWLRLCPTCHHADPELFKLADKFESEMNPKDAPWLFYVWGHSYEFEDKDNWEVIERFCERVSGREDVWYATNIEIYDYVQAYNSLRYSNDMKIMHNPTAQTIWYAVWINRTDRETGCIAPGETKYFD